jgi:hypothetical protein
MIELVKKPKDRVEAGGGVMFSHWTYLLIGRNQTGKTSFQRRLAYHLCGVQYERLPSNVLNNVTNSRSPQGLRTIFTSNRSYQEKSSEYKSVANYFRKFFKDADVCILSSHNRRRDASQMIRQLRQRCYNVAGVFWSNGFDDEAQSIALLPWDEKLWIDNPVLRGEEAIERQLDRIAKEFSEFIIARSQAQ